MNIISFVASNIKRIKTVAITPTGPLVRVTGANGSGKSSTLDGIYYALTGTANIPSMPIRDGAETAEITLKLGEGGVLKYKVTRKFSRGKTSQVVVESPDGARFTSPQALLDRLFGSLTFDPEIFGRMSPKEQLNQLKSLVKLDVDVDALDAQNKADFESRTDVNRRVKTLKESVDLYAGGLVPDMDVEPIDVAEILVKMETASAHNSEVERTKTARVQFEDLTNNLANQATKCREEAARLLRSAEQTDAVVAEQRAKLASADPIPELVDVAELSRSVQEATRENAARQLQRDQRKKHSDAVAVYQLAGQQSDALTDRMAKRTAEKRVAIAAAKMPVDGLALGEGEVLYKGVPFSQASSAERLRVSFQMAMALSPELKIVRIQNGSLLDSNNLAAIGALAEENGFQVWVEEVNDTGDVGIYLEDGEVVSIDGVPVKKDETSA